MCCHGEVPHGPMSVAGPLFLHRFRYYVYRSCGISYLSMQNATPKAVDMAQHNSLISASECPIVTTCCACNPCSNTCPWGAVVMLTCYSMPSRRPHNILLLLLHAVWHLILSELSHLCRSFCSSRVIRFTTACTFAASLLQGRMIWSSSDTRPQPTCCPKLL